MGMIKKLLASAVAAWSIGAVAGELYVDDDADAAVVADGSLEKPFKTIQDAVNKAVFRFEFEPGAGENPGKAVLGPFSRMGCGFSVLVR